MGQEIGLDGQAGEFPLADRFAETGGVPVNDDGGEEVEAGHAVVLAFAGAVADFALASDAEGVLEGVMSLALVQAGVGPALHIGVEEPVDDNEGTFDPSDFAESDGQFVLAWRLSNTLEAGFCAEALEEALAQGQPDVFNTDQGSQFTSWEFTQVLQDRGVKISMDGKGRYQDNIFVERLWRTVKYEEVYLKAYASVLEAQRGLEDYFQFYNGLRPHQALRLPDSGRGVPQGSGCCSRGV